MPVTREEKTPGHEQQIKGLSDVISSPGGKTNGPPKVLIMDDCKLNLAIIRDILEEAGYEVQTAESGIRANQYIYDAAPPDVILIDVVMPLLQGDEKVRFLKGREASRSIPVVLISHKIEAELAELSRQSGAGGYLTKPLEKTTLLTEIRRFL